MPCSGKGKTALHIKVDKWVAKHKGGISPKYNPYAIGYTVLRKQRAHAIAKALKEK